jgi:hypothetical protein
MLGVFYFSIYLFYMKKIVRLTESDLVRIVKRVIKEAEESTSDINYYFNKNAVYAPVSGTFGGVGIQTAEGKPVWLNNTGFKDWPKGNEVQAKEVVDLLYNGVSGLDIAGEGLIKLKKARDEWKGCDLPTQNEVLKQWYIKTKSDGWGSPWRALDDDYENEIANDMIGDSIKKAESFCRPYVDELNRGGSRGNTICDSFVEIIAGYPYR